MNLFLRSAQNWQIHRDRIEVRGHEELGEREVRSDC